MAQTSISVMVPRVRRAVEGPVPLTDAMSDTQMLHVVADAIADIILYTGSAFGHQLVVTADEGGIPTAYATTGELTLPQQGVIAAQAALNIVYFRLMAAKTSERIADESQTWEYTVSSTALRDLLKALTEARDKALGTLENRASLVAYESFIAVRDIQTAREIEPYVAALGGGGGQEIDWRFGTVG
jgi:hypothetical protein